MNFGRSRNGTLVPIIMLLFLFALLPSVVYAAPAITVTNRTSTGLIVPLYAYPDWSWDAYIQAKQANPNVPIIAIINPDNGPGSYQDPNFVSGIRNLQSASISVIGYIWTNHGATSLRSVESSIAKYVNWYGVNGVFFDQMSNVTGHEHYYSTLTSYAKSLGMSMTVGNSGADVPPSYIGTVDTIGIYENSGAPISSFLGDWHTSYAKSNFAIIAYNISSLDTSYVKAASNYLGYTFFTSGNLPDPYSDVVPSYLNSLMATLSTVDGSDGGSTGTITVQSVDLTGTPISGLWTVITSNDQVVATGYTPMTFVGTANTLYTVSVANYQNYVFALWSDGTTSPSQTITLVQNTTLTAYYNT